MSIAGDRSSAASQRWRDRTDLIAGTLTAAARDGVDVADMLAAAARSAAARLDGDPEDEVAGPQDGLERLLAGRSGSWEAELLRQLAGGWEWERPPQSGGDRPASRS